MVRVGLVGCGTIGSAMARALQRNYGAVAKLTALHDIDPARASALARRFHPAPSVVAFRTLFRQCDLVVEAASMEAAPGVVMQALRAHRSVLVMSVGGLLRDQAWEKVARRSRGKVYLASGALIGLDGVKAMAVGRIRHARLTIRKPPRALASAPYVRNRRLHLERLKRPSVIFEGAPEAAVRAFPQNTNIAATLTLALRYGYNSGHALMKRSRAVRPKIRVVADPTIRRNVHELEVEGDCGCIQCRVESVPSVNPKTSELAVRSAIATLDRLFGSISIGT